MACGKQQRGFLLVVAIVLLVVGSMLAAAMAYMVATSGGSATDNLQSGQALFLAGSGGEFEARRMAQNLDWYRSTTDPFDLTTQNFGQGSFTVQTNLPATLLRARQLRRCNHYGLHHQPLSQLQRRSESAYHL